MSKVLSIADLTKDLLVSVPYYGKTMAGIIIRVQKNTSIAYLDIINEAGQYMRNIYITQKDSVIQLAEDKILRDKLAEAIKNEPIRNLHWLPGNLGSDPEIFVVDEKNEIIPSWEFLPSKEEPLYTNGLKTPTYSSEPERHIANKFVNSGATQKMFWDGFQAEFNVYSGSCLEARISSMFAGLWAMNLVAKQHNPKARLTIQSTMDVNPDVLSSARDEHVAFGCMPSFNAYDMSGEKMNGREVPFRSAGGHIHFGISAHLNGNEETARAYVKALDKILGVACVSLFAKFDDPRRRFLYGLAGEYRLPKHGLEYRTLSNAWMSHPLIVNLVYELARKAIGMEQTDLMKYWDASEEETIAAINNCDVELARTILKRNEKVFKDIIYSFSKYADGGVDSTVQAIYNIYMNGMETIVENPDDIEGNWNLDIKKNPSKTIPRNLRSGYEIHSISSAWNYKEVLKMKS